MNTKKRLSALVAGAMALSTFTFTASAEEIMDLSAGNVVISEAGEYRITAKGSTSNIIEISADATVTLAGITIDAEDEKSAISITDGADVKLIIEDDVDLAGGIKGAGIYVEEGSSLNISGEGKLTAIGNNGEDTAKTGAAAIGGTYANGNCGDITLTGANVEVRGYGEHGSGIGSGVSGISGAISIIDSEVVAYGGYYYEGGALITSYGKQDPEGGAAIGGGSKTNKVIGDIEINGSTVEAYGGSKSAAIGCSFWSSCDSIEITDSTITAYGGSSSAAIGTSRYGGNANIYSNIVITNSTVNAQGGEYGSAIGSGYNGDSLKDVAETTITISGGDVTAISGKGGAAVGGGYKGNHLNIEISDDAEIDASVRPLDDDGKKTIAQRYANAIGSGADGSGTFKGSSVVIDETVTVSAATADGAKPAVEVENADGEQNIISGDITVVEEIIYLDFTAQPDDVSKENYTWSADDKVLTLNGVTIISDAKYGIKIPDGTTVIVNGENDITLTGNELGAIYCEGAAVIKSDSAARSTNGSLNITVDKGRAIACIADESALTLENVDITANASIRVGKDGTEDAVSSDMVISGSNINIGENGVDVTCQNGAASLDIDDSVITAGSIYVGAHVMNYTKTTAVFNADNSELLLTGTHQGNYASNLTVWGRSGIDSRIADTYVSTWNRGWNGSSVQFQGGNEINVDILRSNFKMYAWWAELQVNRYYSNDAVVNVDIQDTTMVHYSKRGGAGLKIEGSNDKGGVTNLSDNMSYVNYNCMYGETDERLEKTIVGNPTITQDFEIVNQIGSCDYTNSSFDYTLAENQSVTLADGVTWTMPANTTLNFNEGSQLVMGAESSIGDLKLVSLNDGLDIVSHINAAGQKVYGMGEDTAILEFEQNTTVQAKEGTQVFDLVLRSETGRAIKNFLAGEFKTTLTTNDKIEYVIDVAHSDETALYYDENADGTRTYHLNLKSFDENSSWTTEAGVKKMILGTMTVSGYGSGEISLSDHLLEKHDGTEENRAVEINSNIGNSAIFNVAVPSRELEINIDFPNTANKNAAAYQDMIVTIAGGDLADELEIKLGNEAVEQAVAETIVKGKTAPKYTINVDTENKYVVTLADVLTKDTSYTVTVSGAGYRTARYTVTMTDNKVLNFWNNIKDYEEVVEEGKVSSAKKITFLAGDIVKDNDINIYDLSAVVSYFGLLELNETGEASTYAKYDLNRDGKIDSKDVAYVLASWND